MNYKLIINYKLLILAFICNLSFVIYNLMFPHFSFAAPAYPIPELGNCRDAAECKLYCEVPANTPACWSYGAYVMNVNANQVLGDTTVNITYPITQLGNCASAQECFIYCNQPQNQYACLSYARQNGLVKNDTASESSPSAEIMQAAQTELGCSSKETCMALCNEQSNMDKCRTFAQNHGLGKEPTGLSAKVLQKAQTELGCDGTTSCSGFCQKVENRDKCYQFAKENNLIPAAEVEKVQKMQAENQQLLETAKTELGCDTQTSCYTLCTNPANRDKCSALTHQFSGTQNSTGQNLPSVNALNNYPSASGGGNLGPGGCKTESECKSYCQAHPDQCPGFPRTSTNTPGIQSVQNFSASPPPFNPNTNPTGNQNFKPSSTPLQSRQQIGGSFKPLPSISPQYPDR